MEISKQSWHFRFYQWFCETTDTGGYYIDIINLCPYVRILAIWAPLLWILACGKLIPRIYNGFLWIAAGILAIGYYWHKWDAPGFWHALIVLAMVVVSIAVIVGIVFLVLRYGSVQPRLCFLRVSRRM